MKFYSNLAVLSGISFIATHTVTGFEIEYPEIRFTAWNDLTDDQVIAAASMEYDENLWNEPGSASIEGATYDGDNRVFATYARVLGFTGREMWDCWMNHYNGYNWEDIVTYGIEPSLVALGWNETMWESGGALVPESDNKWWDQFTDAEKTAAVAMCYTKNLWNEDKLSSFCMDSPRGLRRSPTSRRSQSCTWVANDMSRCRRKNNGYSIHCRNTCGKCFTNKCVDTKSGFFWKQRRRDKKNLYKRCGFVGKIEKPNRCKKEGMKETCPAQCNDECPIM